MTRPLPEFLSFLPPAILAVLLQGAACIAVWLAAWLAGIAFTPMQFALASGLVAATLSYAAGLAGWWLPIQLAFVPGLLWMTSLALPSGYYLAAFLILLAVYWSTFQTQVPLYLSSSRVAEELLGLMPTGRPFTFIDLGCGLGGVLVRLAKACPQGRFHGVVLAPLPYLVSRLRIALSGCGNCRVRWRSIWSTDLGRYDVVFAYLSPAPMPKLWQKVRGEMRGGTLFISNTFAVPGEAASEMIETRDVHRSVLYLWRM